MRYQLYYFPHRDVKKNYYPYMMVVDGYVSKCWFDIMDYSNKEANITRKTYYANKYTTNMELWSRRVNEGMNREPQLTFECATKKEMEEFLDKLKIANELEL